MPSDAETPRRSAEAVVRTALAFLRQRLGGAFDDCVSVGVMGSLGRGDLVATSDVDFYIVFDVHAFGRAGIELGEAAMSAIVEETARHVGHECRENPFAPRFSAYWTSLDSLESGRCDIGRWPAYDRQAFLESGRHLAGKHVRKERVPEVSQETIVSESAMFLIEVVGAKLEAAGLFENIPDLDAGTVARLGPVVVTKAATMPVRVLYTLAPVDDRSRVVSTERAVSAGSRRFGDRSWWELVEAAMAWRERPPSDPQEWGHAARLLRREIVNLYLCCMTELSSWLRSRGVAAGPTEALERWAENLRRLSDVSATPAGDA